MKKILTLLLGILLAMGLIYALAENEPTVYTSGDYKYILLEDGTAEITDYTGKANFLTIASELDGFRVTVIGDKAFQYTSLTSVSIPDSVTSVEDYAFSDCNSLTSISIPDSVTSIGDCAFYGCTDLISIFVSPNHPTLATIDGVLFEKSTKALIFYPCAFTSTSYTIPQGIRIIGDSAFSDCRSLTSVSIPNSVISIGDCAFSHCTGLTSISIPDSVTSIGNRTFSHCTDLTSINIPDSVTSIGENPFAFCSRVSISVSSDHPMLTIIDGVLFDKSTQTLICYPRSYTARGYAIPQGTQIIGGYAFYDCFSLTTISIPDSVTSIGDSAFYSCSLTSITIPNSVTSIGNEAFSYCSDLTTIFIPDSVTLIGDWAFSDCRSLTSICIPDSVTSIGLGAFHSFSSPPIITVSRDSYAAQYCKDNNLPCTYPDANDWLLN